MYKNIFIEKDYDNFQKYRDNASYIYVEDFSLLKNLLTESIPLVFCLFYPSKKIIHLVSKDIYSHHKFFILCKNTYFLKGYMNKNNMTHYESYIKDMQNNNIKNIPTSLLINVMRGVIIKNIMSVSNKNERKELTKKLFNIFFTTKNINMSINLLNMIKNS